MITSTEIAPRASETKLIVDCNCIFFAAYTDRASEEPINDIP